LLQFLEGEPPAASAALTTNGLDPALL
jgi:hypothetical protein